jgi:hypothetical protein
MTQGSSPDLQLQPGLHWDCTFWVRVIVVEGRYVDDQTTPIGRWQSRRLHILKPEQLRVFVV